MEGRFGGLVVCDGNAAETKAFKGFVVHGNQALASLGEGGHGWINGNVVAGGGAVGAVVCECGGSGDDEVSEFDVGKLRCRGLRCRELAIVACVEGEGGGVVGVHVSDYAGFDRIGRWVC